MEHYVTIFNNLFLPHGLALYASMERKIEKYVLWILCVDDETYDVLEKLALPNIRLLKLSNLETRELLDIKSKRTIGEYCWTLTPISFRYVFDSDQSVDRVTYIDADLWFLKKPKLIFDEFQASGKNVLITDHAYAPEYDQSEKFGKFCVQFITITREGGEPVRQWWENRCKEWCFARLEDGKFGDQKYLDDWPELFSSLVHVLGNKESTLAPWNAIRFPYGNAIFYHFHGLKIISRKKLKIGAYSLPATLIENVYKPYGQDLKHAINLLETAEYSWKTQVNNENMLRRFYMTLRRLRHISHLLVPSNYMKWQ